MEIENQDVKMVLESLNTKLEKDESGKTKVVFDSDSLESTLEKIKTNRQAIVLENDLMGLRVQMVSSQPMKELQKTAHESLIFMQKNTPTRIPLGVG